MLVLSQAHRNKSQELTQKLSAARGVNEACDIVCGWIDDITANYMSQSDFVYSRQLTNGLADTAKQSVRTMSAVDKAAWRYVPTAEKRSKFDLKDMAKYAPSALMLITALTCLITSQTVGLCLSVIAAAAGVVIPSFIKDRPPVEAAPVVNADEVAACVGRLFEVMDVKLAESVNEVIVDAPRLTRSVIEGIQMLMEAKVTKDGDYALKSVPQLADSLRRQGVTFEVYMEATKGDFDLLPSLEAGETIRPAVRQGEKLLLRGQATTEIKRQLAKGEVQ